MELLAPELGIIIWTVIILLLLGLIPTFIALINILKNDFKDSTIKLIWVLVAFFPFIGPILCFFIGRNQILKTT
jgi:uncharacterized membrane protein YhaH (DUF805 family)